VLYPLATPTATKNNNTVGIDQVLGNLITTLDTVIVYALHVSEVKATLTAVGKELDPDY